MEKTGSNQKVYNPAEINPQGFATPFTASDLPIDGQGRIYHIQLKPDQIAPDILLVGDPGRAEFFGSHLFHDLEVSHEHRGLVTITGIAAISGEKATILSPMKTTVATSGMGTPSLEIVVNELVAMHEINFERRTQKPDYPILNVIRLGTSGGLQESTELGTAIITTYALGLDNTGLFYEVPCPDETCRWLEDEIDQLVNSKINPSSRFFGKIHPYVSRADPTLVSALEQAASSLGLAYKKGLTVSAPGFFLPQGRDISRIQPSIPELDQIFTEYDPGLDGQRFENMEMEASFLLHFLGGLGHRAGTICLAIVNRRLDTFTANYHDAILKAGEAALLALANLRLRNPDHQMQ
jgi:uridine phosphorylase